MQLRTEEGPVSAVPVVSFDFDDTLWDGDAREFIWDTIALLRKHLAAGDRVVIVTAREEVWVPECHELLAQLKLKLEVFSAPDDVRYLSGPKARTKHRVLVALGAVKHYDDLAEIPVEDDFCGFAQARADGIEVVLPPATQAFKVGMY